MNRVYPCIEIDVNKVKHNTKTIVDKCTEAGINVYGVTKVFCAEMPVVNAIIEGGVSTAADSRIQNLKKIKDVNCTKVLLRLPSQSGVDEVVEYADISLNSELETIKMLSEAAGKIGKVHRIILMIDLGDLREGIWEDDVIDVVNEVKNLPNIKIEGIGTNLTCYGGIIPDDTNLGKLVEFKERIEKETQIELKVISGGNSSSYYKVLDETLPKEINNLRIGEGIVLGRETAYGNKIEGCFTDAFIIKGEIVELKEKPSLPIGKIGMDAFGNVPHYEDKGIMKRAIIAIGRQDVNVDGLIPLDEESEIMGASSDHLILDVTNCNRNYKVGDVVEFNVEYGALLQAMTSEYIDKYYLK